MSKRRNYDKWFWSYRSAMVYLKISRRTLQRWLDDMSVEPLYFEDHQKVFLEWPSVQCLKEYGDFMATHDQALIKRYRDAVEKKSKSALYRLRRELRSKSDLRKDLDETAATVATVDSQSS